MRNRGVQRRPIGQRQAVEVFEHSQLHFGLGVVAHFVQPPEQLLGLALHDRHAKVGELLRQDAGRGADDQHTGLRLFGQQAGHDLAFQVERDQRRVEDVEICALRRPVDNILNAMPQPGEDRGQMGIQQGRRAAIAAVEPPHDCVPPRRPCGHGARRGTCRRQNRRQNLSRRQVGEYPRGGCSWSEQGAGSGEQGYLGFGIWDFSTEY